MPLTSILTIFSQSSTISGKGKGKAVEKPVISDDEYKKSAIDHGVSLDSDTWKQKKSKKQTLIDKIWENSLENEKALAENRAELERMWWSEELHGTNDQSQKN